MSDTVPVNPLNSFHHILHTISGGGKRFINLSKEKKGAELLAKTGRSCCKTYKAFTRSVDKNSTASKVEDILKKYLFAADLTTVINEFLEVINRGAGCFNTPGDATHVFVFLGKGMSVLANSKNLCRDETAKKIENITNRKLWKTINGTLLIAGICFSAYTKLPGSPAGITWQVGLLLFQSAGKATMIFFTQVWVKEFTVNSKEIAWNLLKEEDIKDWSPGSKRCVVIAQHFFALLDLSVNGVGCYKEAGKPIYAPK